MFSGSPVGLAGFFLRLVTFLRFFCVLLAAELLAAETGAVAFPASSAGSVGSAHEGLLKTLWPDA